MAPTLYAMLRCETLPVTPFQQNCSLIWCDRTREAAVVDPGGEVERITAAARRHGVAITQILLTHAHIDHAGGTGTLARMRGVIVEALPRDVEDALRRAWRDVAAGRSSDPTFRRLNATLERYETGGH